MIGYKDMTFCPFFKDCKEGKTCPRAMTEQIVSDANDFGMGIMQYMDKPFCWKEKRKHGIRK